MKTFSQVASEWLVLHSTNIKPISVTMYERKITQLNELIGNVAIDKINFTQVQTIVNNMYWDNKARSTIQKTKITLGLVFKYAVRTGIIKTDPCQYLQMPRLARKSQRIGIDDSQVAIIIKNVNNHPFGLYVYMLLMLGLRRSELLALRYEDLDFEHKLAYVHAVVNYDGNIPVLSQGLKNKKAGRRVAIPDALIKLLKLMNLPTMGYIFHKDGKLLIQSQVCDMWEDYKETTGLMATQHMIRHTYATLLYRSGVDVKTAQYLLGHADIHTTLQIYTHLSEEQARKNVDKFDEFLSVNF